MDRIDRYITIKTNREAPRRGSVLLSEPLMGDYYFGRSVVLLAEHNDEGTFGVIMNKPLEQSLNEAVPHFPNFEGRIFLGGPVEKNSLFYIHSFGDLIEDSVDIGRGLYWGGSIEMIKDLILVGKLTSDNIRFYAGYSGWSPHQLNNELSRNAWIVTDIPDQNILAMESDKMWNNLLSPLGEQYAYWSKFPKNPELN
jgi:putative transcriptional regulator